MDFYELAPCFIVLPVKDGMLLAHKLIYDKKESMPPYRVLKGRMIMIF